MYLYFVGIMGSVLKFEKFWKYGINVTLLFSDLKKIAENGQMPLDLEPYVKKLNTSRRRVTLVNNILQNVQVGWKSQIIITIIKL